MSTIYPTLHCPCDNRYLETALSYNVPPEGETRFDLNGQAYKRHYKQCRICGHYFSFLQMNVNVSYGNDYVNATYGDAAGMQATFERIINLPPNASDNAARTQRINHFVGQHLGKVDKQQFSLLDIGSGLCVFPYAMQRLGWHCTALDPDPRASFHAQQVAGVACITGDYTKMETNQLGKFDVITFNKVLEHIEAPVAMLNRSLKNLSANGVVYIEVPDGEGAAIAGPGREEFFIEHHHVFSVASLDRLIKHSGYNALQITRIREPSGKFTLYAFLNKAQQTQTMA